MSTTIDRDAPAGAAEREEAAISACVRRFYELARADELIGPVFDGIRDWDRHLATMDDFWSRALLGTERYEGAPLPTHVPLALRQAHFDRWRDLWFEAVRAHLRGEMAARAMMVAEHMAHCWGGALDRLTVARGN